MRPTWTFLAVIFACVHLNAAEPNPSRQQIEKDLALQISLTSPKTIQVGQQVDVDLVLRNQSRDKSYPIVPPGDGSEMGWREPFVYFTATLDTGDGVPKAVPAARNSRCGLFDFDWQKDARTLKPGEELPMKDWLDAPSNMLEFQEAGRVRLVAHYQYRAGAIEKREKPPVVTGLMAGVPAFEVVSAPVEFEIVRPLELVLRVKAPLTVEAKTKLSELFDVRLVNRSKEPIEVSSPTLTVGARLSLAIEGEFPGWPPIIDEQKTTYGEKMTLKPGEEVSVLGAGPFANGMNGTWRYPVKDTVKVRATFYTSTGSVIQSNWAEIKVTEGKGK